MEREEHLIQEINDILTAERMRRLDENSVPNIYFDATMGRCYSETEIRLLRAFSKYQIDDGLE